MDLGDLREMPKMSGGKASSVHTAAPARDVGVSPAREAPKASSKRLIDAPTEIRRGGRVASLPPPEVHEGPFQDQGPQGRCGVLCLAYVRSGPSRPRQEDEGQMGGLKNSAKVWNDSSAAEEFERGLLHPQLARELCTLPSEVLVARAAKEMVLVSSCPCLSVASFLLIEFLSIVVLCRANTYRWCTSTESMTSFRTSKRERDEVLQRLEASDKGLSEVWSNLAEIQRLLKEARVRARKMDDELLQSVKALENARAELPRQAVDRYKESADFKEGLNRMG
ncbi:hypothetical protein B296_00024709 [Ensete ventricosum]|uniref:Uncharacterized protein n=1 Tax=Ensete ventricosum TaxID=4639 RepID=A0A426XRD9_ENSVE|nr:hypothetical protein B296_00024709 [Ensete ventricosum]